MSTNAVAPAKVEKQESSFVTFLMDNLRTNGILFSFAILIVVMAFIEPSFLSPSNLTNLILQYAHVLILSIGMLLVIVLGQIDLSVGSVVALAGSVSVYLIFKMDQPWWVGVLAALAVGLVVGAWQGFWVAVVGIPGFIVSLGGMLIFRGLAQIIIEYQTLQMQSGSFYQKISNGFLNGLFGGSGYDLFTLVVFGIGVVGFAVAEWRSRMGQIKYQQAVSPLPFFIGKIVLVGAVAMAFAWRISHDRGLPVVLILLAVLVMVYGLVMSRTTFGRHIYAIGGNLNAAQLSGVKVKQVTFWAFVNMGVLAAVAGIIYSARSNSAQPGAGNGLELDAIAACFIGGASTTGGIGRVGGAMIGGLIMAALTNGMQLLGVEIGYQPVVKGVILIIAVAFDLVSKRRAAAG